MQMDALKLEHACHIVKVQGGNAGAGDTSERCCDWCNEVLQEIFHPLITSMQVEKEHECLTI